MFYVGKIYTINGIMYMIRKSCRIGDDCYIVLAHVGCWRVVFSGRLQGCKNYLTEIPGKMCQEA